jgi:hypothetical protein
MCILITMFLFKNSLVPYHRISDHSSSTTSYSSDRSSLLLTRPIVQISHMHADPLLAPFPTFVTLTLSFLQSLKPLFFSTTRLTQPMRQLTLIITQACLTQCVAMAWCENTTATCQWRTSHKHFKCLHPATTWYASYALLHVVQR